MRLCKAFTTVHGTWETLDKHLLFDFFALVRITWNKACEVSYVTSDA